jgi:ribosomal-protein-alanine acetyltransferase
MPQPTIRLASQHDLDQLLKLELSAFAADRFTEDQIEYLLTRARSSVLLVEQSGRLLGAAYLLWRRGSKAGRLYSIAISPEAQGRGMGTLLLEECEKETAVRGRENLLLEVRVDNEAAVRFYQKHGFAITGRLPHYYEDGTDGLKMARRLPGNTPEQLKRRIPYYPQTLDFTCGPASLLMAMRHLDDTIPDNRIEELNLWKESTLIYMTSGVGGAGPYGLALAARRRGFSARVLQSSDRTPFYASVRSDKKRAVIKLVHQDLKHRAEENGVATAVFDFGLEDIISLMVRGMIPITLISTYRLTGDKTPHWVVITGFDRHKIYIHDSDAESYQPRLERARHIAIERSEFLRMNRYGKDVFRCAVFIGPRHATR